MRKWNPLFLLPTAFLTGACTVSLDAAEETAIDCSASTRCPTGWVCVSPGDFCADPLTADCIVEAADGAWSPAPDGNLCGADDERRVCVAGRCDTSICGDGYTDPEAGEQCDDGADNSASEPDRCRPTCALPGCGDGTVDDGEICDDGGLSAECDGDCTPSACGDGFVNSAAGESCDEPESELTDSCPYGETQCLLCDASCQAAAGATSFCGDGAVDAAAGETCDDGENNAAGWHLQPHCNSTCTGLHPYCGDGLVNGPESCDDGYRDRCGTCDELCADPGVVPVCGDGLVCEETEGCDDGGESSACDLDCTDVACGDGTTNATAGETCDDGPLNDDGWALLPHCNGDCSGLAPHCGDQVLNAAAGELCDDGDSTASCETNCQPPTCGDGIRSFATGEVCDAGGETRACTASCTKKRIIAAGEDHACAVLTSGELKCWGLNDVGQLGIGAVAEVGNDTAAMGGNLPAVDLGSGAVPVQVAAGHRHTCALLASGEIKCWGANGQGQLGQGDTQPRGRDLGDMGDSLLPIALGTGRTASEVVAGEFHTCALLDDGAVKCWGTGQYGICGLAASGARGDQPGEMGDALPPIDLGAGNAALSIYSGRDHVCALLTTRQLKCWGRNSFGQLGLEDTDNRGDQAGEMGDALPEVNVGPDRWAVSVTLGFHHTCALLDDRSIRCWGAGSSNRHATGEVFDVGVTAFQMGRFLRPANIGGQAARLIDSADQHTCAILTDDRLVCWGNNATGQLGGGSHAPFTQPEEMGLALAAVPIDAASILAVTAGRTQTGLGVEPGAFTCVMKTDGAVLCWGSPEHGKLGWPLGLPQGDDAGEVQALRPVPLLAACGNGILEPGELCDDGFTDACGSCNADCTAAGSGATCGDGQLCPESETCDEGGEASDCDADCTPATCGDGTPNGTAGEVCDDGFNDDCGSCNADCSGAGSGAICGDGLLCPETEICDQGGPATYCTVDCWVRPALAVGGEHVCALAADGRVRCWGSIAAQRLGCFGLENVGDDPGEMGADLETVDLGARERAMSIAAGEAHTCALLASGGIKCWGDNSRGQLGLGDTTARGMAARDMGDDLPTVGLGTDRFALALAAGRRFNCALLDNGWVKCWGDNDHLQTGVVTLSANSAIIGDQPAEMGDWLPAVWFGDDGAGNEPQAVAVAAGREHACAVLTGGEVRCWGSNAYGNLGLEQPVTSLVTATALDPVLLGTGDVAVEIAAGSLHTCARLSDGAVKCWGSGARGMLGVGDQEDVGETAGEMGDNLGAALLGTGRTASDICVGRFHSCALLDGDAVKCWGSGRSGATGLERTDDVGIDPAQLGDNLAEVNLGAGVGVSAIWCGETYVSPLSYFSVTCALTLDQRVKCWGDNVAGQLGQEHDDDAVGGEVGDMGNALPYTDPGW